MLIAQDLADAASRYYNSKVRGQVGEFSFTHFFGDVSADMRAGAPLPCTGCIIVDAWIACGAFTGGSSPTLELKIVTGNSSNARLYAVTLNSYIGSWAMPVVLSAAGFYYYKNVNVMAITQENTVPATTSDGIYNESHERISGQENIEMSHFGLDLTVTGSPTSIANVTGGFRYIPFHYKDSNFSDALRTGFPVVF